MLIMNSQWPTMYDVRRAVTDHSSTERPLANPGSGNGFVCTVRE